MTKRLLVGTLLLAAAGAVGVGVWANRPVALETRCPDGSEPQVAAISAVVGSGPEAAGATLVLEPGSAKLQVAGAPSRELSADERAALLERLENPSAPAAAEKAVVVMSRTCGGVEESRVVGSAGRAALGWLERPHDVNRFRSAVAEAVAAIDPQTRKALAVASELLAAAYR